MAHQADKIPWHLLTDKLEVSFMPYGPGSVSNLRWKSDTDRDDATFVKEFTKYLEEQIRLERLKYPKTYTPPAEEEVVLTGEQIRRIAPAMQRMVLDQGLEKDWTIDDNCVRHGRNTGLESKHTCTCQISFDKLTMKYMRCIHNQGDCKEFDQVNGQVYFSSEVIKVLLMEGEMDTLLKMTADEEVEYSVWHNVGMCICCNNPDLGWDRIHEYALQSYIWLNVLYCFPEIWEPNPGQHPTHDYRSLALYQHMVRYSTMVGSKSDTATFPFRDFFDVDKNRFVGAYELEGIWSHLNPFLESFYGMMEYQDFLNFEQRVAPAVVASSATLACIRETLRAKRLPDEIIQGVLQFTGYIGGSKRPKVLHHPFHVENRQLLLDHLDYCWRLLLRCGMFWEANKERPQLRVQLNRHFRDEIVPNWKYATFAALGSL